MSNYKRLVVILLMISALLLLLGCTPDRDETGAANTLPDLTGSNQTLPAGQNGNDPGSDGQTASGELAGTDGPADTSGNPGTGEVIPTTEEDIVEVESNTDSTYNFVVSEGYGVGGN